MEEALVIVLEVWIPIPYGIYFTMNGCAKGGGKLKHLCTSWHVVKGIDT